MLTFYLGSWKFMLLLYTFYIHILICSKYVIADADQHIPMYIIGMNIFSKHLWIDKLYYYGERLLNLCDCKSNKNIKKT